MWLLLTSSAFISLPPGVSPLVTNYQPSDILTCAQGNGTDDGFEKCPIWAKTNVIPFCVYMRTPSTTNVSGYETYGCVYGEDLPQECMKYGEFFSEHAQVQFRQGTVTGEMVCCRNNFCNRISDPLIQLVRLTKDSSYNGMNPSTLTLYAWFLLMSFAPLIVLFVYRRHASDLELLEASDFFEQHHDDKDQAFVFKEEVFEQKMHFNSYKTMMLTVKEVGKGDRFYGSSSQSGVTTATAGHGSSGHSPMGHQEDEELLEVEERAPRPFGEKPQLERTVNVFQKDDEEPYPVMRYLPTTLSSLAERLIEHGPFRFNFDAVELGQLFDACSNVLRREPTLLELQPGMMVYGNLEGSYGDLFRWLHKFGWPPRQRVLFLGGLGGGPEADYGLETVALVLALKRAHPNHVYMLRGPSEVYPMHQQLQTRFPLRQAQLVTEILETTFSYLPLAALVGGEILLCHGAPSKTMKHLKQINKISRPLSDIRMGSLAADLIFSTAGRVAGPIGGARGCSFDSAFEPDIRTGLGKDHRVHMVVRARNSCRDGFVLHNEKMLTLWSTCGPTRRGEQAAAGAALYISKRLQLRLFKMGPFGTYSARQIYLAEQKRKEQEAARGSKERPPSAETGRASAEMTKKSSQMTTSAEGGQKKK